MQNHWAIGLLILSQRKDIQLLARLTAEPWNRPAEKARPLRKLNITRLLAPEPEREPECDPICGECCCETV
jgi:hypothetical protein